MVAHNTLTGSELHESKGADTAAINTVPVSNGAGSAPFQTLTYAQMPSGSLIGSAFVTDNTQYSTGAAIPDDNTIPQNTEGGLGPSISYTPKMVGSTLVFESSIVYAQDTDTTVCIALFLNTELNARAASSFYITTVNTTPLNYSMTSPSTSLQTFTIRFGSTPASGSSWLNRGKDTNQRFGGVLSCFLSVKEYKA